MPIESVSIGLHSAAAAAGIMIGARVGKILLKCIQETDRYRYTRVEGLYLQIQIPLKMTENGSKIHLEDANRLYLTLLYLRYSPTLIGAFTYKSKARLFGVNT